MNLFEGQKREKGEGEGRAAEMGDDSSHRCAERLSDSRAERRTTNSDVKTAGKKLRAAKVKGGMGGMGRWEEIAVCK